MVTLKIVCSIDFSRLKICVRGFISGRLEEKNFVNEKKKGSSYRFIIWQRTDSSNKIPGNHHVDPGSLIRMTWDLKGGSKTLCHACTSIKFNILRKSSI